jgi:CRISPR-associated protein Cas6
MPLDHTHSVSCTIEAAFPLHGDHLPAQHGVALYATLCELPDLGAWLEEADDIAIAPISGRVTEHLLALTPDSRILLRLPAAELPRVLCLAGRRLDVAGHALDLDQPQVRVPQAAADLYAGLVVLDEHTGAETRNYADPEGDAQTRRAFDAALRRHLAALEILAEPALGPPGTLRVPEGSLRGFAVGIGDLAPDDSIHLQEAGLGAHRKLGCGVFLPI